MTNVYNGNQLFNDNSEQRDNYKLHLDRQQKLFFDILLEKNKRIAEMYMGALMTLNNSENPEMIAQAAHSIRELIEKIPQIVDVETYAMKESLKNKIQDLKIAWDKAISKSKCNNNYNWEGEIDTSLSKFLIKNGEFMNWFETHHPKRKVELINLLRKLDNSAIGLPYNLEDLNTRVWDEIRSFFQAVAHHRKIPDIVTFKKWLNALESFLLDRLCPRTFDDMEMIDSIIREGENRSDK